jgi:penicillin-binding protein 1A
MLVTFVQHASTMKNSVKWLWRIYLIGLILFVGIIIAAKQGLLGEMPKLSELENPKSMLASEIYSSEGGMLGKYYLEYREPVVFKEISPNVIDALVSTEDERFFSHCGVDAEAIGRALKGVVTFNPSGGASTLSQQLAKALLGQGSKNIFQRLTEKIKEQVVAVMLERNLTKNEILTAYLNTVPFGQNAFGIKAASRVYFNKKPDSLLPEEAAVLVGLLKANTLYNPIKHPDASKGRRNVVLQKMIDNGKLSLEAGERLKLKPLVLDVQPILDYEEMPAPYFRQVVEQDVKEWCKKKGLNLYKDGLKIYTTIDTMMQKHAERAVAEYAPHLSRGRGTWRWSKKQKYLENVVLKNIPRYLNMKEQGMKHEQILEELKKPVKMKVFTWNGKHEKDTTISPIDSVKIMRAYVQAGLMAMDPASGEVKAWVGGIDHRFFKYDHCGYNTRRQVGSTIKPLLYCLAVDNNYSPCQPVSCAPVFFPGHRLYNAGGGSYGTLAMKNALAYSVNNATLYILKQTGIRSFVDFCKKCGIVSKIEEYPSLALGAFEISLIEMLRTYTMFPNLGINTKPIYITRIEDRNGNLLENFVPERNEIINEQTAYKMIRMMQGTTSFGTGKNLKPRFGIKGEVAGKTGTTNDEADAWFIGYTPTLLGGVWVGCEDRFMGLGLGQGSTAAMPMWGAFFKYVQNDARLKYGNELDFEIPPSMEGVDICDMLDKSTLIRRRNVRNVVRKAATPKAETESTNADAAPVDDGTEIKEEFTPIGNEGSGDKQDGM